MDTFTLAERLDYGNLFVNEICRLKSCSRSKFYEDLAQGKVSIEKIGSRSVVRGPVAKRYIQGLPIDDLVASLSGEAA